MQLTACFCFIINLSDIFLQGVRNDGKQTSEMTENRLSSPELIKRINEKMEREGNRRLQEKGVTLSQLKVLLHLMAQSGHDLTLKELESYFGMSQATIAGIAARLEKKKLVTGFGDRNDRRIKHIRVSAAGEALCRDAEEEKQAGDAWLVRCLSDEEKSLLNALLAKVYEGMDA